MRIRHEDQIDVARAPSAVLEFLLDIEAQPRYWAGVVAVRRLAGSPGRPGTTYERTIRVLGRRRATTIVIRAVEPARLLVLDGASPQVHVQARIETRAGLAGATLVVQLEAEVAGGWRLLAPLLRRRFARNTRRTLETAERLLEAPYQEPPGGSRNPLPPPLAGG